jgi:hypothetical protein
LVSNALFDLSSGATWGLLGEEKGGEDEFHDQIVQFLNFMSPHVLQRRV